MAFYESISQWYSHIFPLSEKKVQFVKALSTKAQPDVTETGCATGEFAMALTKAGCRVFGFDLDEEMINMCRELPEYSQFHNDNTTDSLINFKTLNMLKIESEPLSKDCDIACCFGNTLVHLSSLSQIESYIRAVYAILNSEGIFTGQIVNYDRIILGKLKGLPTIDNQFISFKRDYSCVNGTDYDESEDCPDGTLKISFKTELLVKETDRVVKNSIPLLALKKAVLEKMLKDAGFSSINFYGNYNKEPWSINSGPTIFTASKSDK